MKCNRNLTLVYINWPMVILVSVSVSLKVAEPVSRALNEDLPYQFSLTEKI